MPFYFEVSQNINSMTRHLRFGHISIFANLLWISMNLKSSYKSS